MREFYRLTVAGKILLVGVGTGGISSAADAYAKIRAGATLVQLYTALVYQGFSAVRRIQAGLAELLEKDGFSSVRQAVGGGCAVRKYAAFWPFLRYNEKADKLHRMRRRE